MDHIFTSNCPFCGRRGRQWHDKPEAFICPNCNSVFSRFGIVADGRMQEFEEDDDERISN